MSWPASVCGDSRRNLLEHLSSSCSSCLHFCLWSQYSPSPSSRTKESWELCRTRRISLLNTINRSAIACPTIHTWMYPRQINTTQKCLRPGATLAKHALSFSSLPLGSCYSSLFWAWLRCASAKKVRKLDQWTSQVKFAVLGAWLSTLVRQSLKFQKLNEGN